MESIPDADILKLIDEMSEETGGADDVYSAMCSFFSAKSEQLSECGEPGLAEAAATLASITHMALDAESRNEPIVPAFVLIDKRSVSPADLHPAQRAFLEALYPALETGLLKSRIAEVSLLLDTPRRWELVDEIIAGYLREPLSEQDWMMRQQAFWTRAVVLSRQFSKKDPIQHIEAQIDRYLDEHGPGNEGISFQLLNFVRRQLFQRSNAEKNAARVMSLASHQKSHKNYQMAERFFLLAEDFYKLIRNQAGYVSAIFESAECLFLEAESRALVSDMGNMIASQIYEQALQRYRRIPAPNRNAFNADEQIVECLRRIRMHGELSLNEMHAYQLPPCDVSEMASVAVNHVRDKRDIFEASLYFVGLQIITSESTQENDEKKQFRLSELFGAVYMSGDGRAVGRTGITGKDHARVRQQQLFDISLQVAVTGHILPAMHRLIQEYNLTLPYFEELCHCSPLVPENRMTLTARGLYLGFEYRFSESIHLLSPQVEFLVRSLLKRGGVITSTINEAGIETEVGLSSLLDKAEAKTLLGDELHFNLASLFTDPFGANIRNYVAHGLLNDYSSESDAVIYAWWLYLKIIVSSVTEMPLIRIPNT